MDLAAPLLCALVALLYFFPTFVAALREHQKAGAILVLNLFLGWTILGWIVALVWASTAIQQSDPLHEG